MLQRSYGVDVPLWPGCMYKEFLADLAWWHAEWPEYAPQLQVSFLQIYHWYGYVLWAPGAAVPSWVDNGCSGMGSPGHCTNSA